MEFLDTVTNDAGGEIVARDAILRFQPDLTPLPGLINNENLILGGDTIVHGTILNTGTITILMGSIETIVGDLRFTEPAFLIAPLSDGEVAALLEPPNSNAINITVGNNPGSLNVIGDVTFSSGTMLDLDYSSDVGSQAGDSFQVLSANNIAGSFANTRTVADGRYWDISYSGDEVHVTASSDLFTETSGDFNGDGVVSGIDFLAWQRGFGSSYDAGDLDNWETNYGGGTPLLAAAAAAVPEPSALMLALLALAFGCRRRVA